MGDSLSHLDDLLTDIKHYFDSEILRFEEVCLHALLTFFLTRAS